jgi:hypothetical protein
MHVILYFYDSTKSFDLWTSTIMYHTCVFQWLRIQSTDAWFIKIVTYTVGKYHLLLLGTIYSNLFYNFCFKLTIKKKLYTGIKQVCDMLYTQQCKLELYDGMIVVTNIYWSVETLWTT